MKEQIVEYIVKNKFKLKAETADLRRDREVILKKEPKDFHELVNNQYQEKLRGHVIRDISMNLGVDYETSMIELEGVNLEEVLK